MNRRRYAGRLRRVNRDHQVRTFPDEKTLLAAWRAFKANPADEPRPVVGAPSTPQGRRHGPLELLQLLLGFLRLLAGAIRFGEGRYLIRLQLL